MTLEKQTDNALRQAAGFQRFVKFEHHFVGVNKMVPAGHSEKCAGFNAGVRKLEASIAENVVELLESV